MSAEFETFQKNVSGTKNKKYGWTLNMEMAVTSQYPGNTCPLAGEVLQRECGDHVSYTYPPLGF